MYTHQWDKVRAKHVQRYRNQSTNRWLMVVCIWSWSGKSEVDCVGWLRTVKWNGANGTIYMDGWDRMNSMDKQGMEPTYLNVSSLRNTKKRHWNRLRKWKHKKYASLLCYTEIVKASRIGQCCTGTCTGEKMHRNRKPQSRWTEHENNCIFWQIWLVQIFGWARLVLSGPVLDDLGAIYPQKGLSRNRLGAILGKPSK